MAKGHYNSHLDLRQNINDRQRKLGNKAYIQLDEQKIKMHLLT